LGEEFFESKNREILQIKEYLSLFHHLYYGSKPVLSQDFWILFPILLQDSYVFLTKKVLIWLLTEEIILVDGLCWVPGAGVSRSGRPPLR
jgi:hypothetical protein